MNHPTTPAPLLPQLLDLELQRIALNMQISLTHSLARQAIECAAKMAQAEAIYQRRVDQHAPRNTKESVPLSARFCDERLRQLTAAHFAPLHSAESGRALCRIHASPADPCS